MAEPATATRFLARWAGWCRPAPERQAGGWARVASSSAAPASIRKEVTSQEELLQLALMLAAPVAHKERNGSILVVEVQRCPSIKQETGSSNRSGGRSGAL